MIKIKADQLSEQHLAEVALAVQNRWNVATFVKMHEIIVMDDEVDDESLRRIVSAPIDAREVERGMRVIMGNLELDRAFALEKDGKSNFKLKLIDATQIPKWVERSTSNMRQPPEGVFECPHCVPPDTLILGDNKAISGYSKGDSVIGQTGLTEVQEKFVHPYKGDLVIIRANGLLPIVTTPEHPIMVANSRSLSTKALPNEVLFSIKKWVSAKDAVPKNSGTDGDYLIVPLINGSFQEYEVSLLRFIKKMKPRHKAYRTHFPLNEGTAWLLGIFVAEGSVTKEVRFSLNKKEKQIEAKIATIASGLGYSSYISSIQNWNSMLVSIPSRVLARAFDEWCGHKAPNRMMPDFILFHRDERILRAFLDGYEAGDSYVATNKLRGYKRYKCDVTVSRTLALQLQLAYARLGRWASICQKKSEYEEEIMNRKCRVHVKYAISYPLEPNLKRRKVHFVEDSILSPIRKVEKLTYDGTVHNVNTSDGTYLVSNAIVHNCGRWFSTDLELSMHTKLHYII